MKITSLDVSLNVPDAAASAEFAKRHFGFTESMAADGFVALSHPDAAPNLIFLDVGLPSFKPASHAGAAREGLLLALTVEDLDEQFARIAAGGARVVTKPETEPWGERFCQFADPNGVLWQLVQWVTEPTAQTIQN
ncbi:MAG: VOC family protein [Rhodococcus sp. (in: high G+C Gram-positive bacteria)]